MKAEFRKDDIGKVKDKLLCVFLMQNEKLPKELAAFSKDFKEQHSELKLDQTFATCTLEKAKFRHLLIVGLGKKKEFRKENLRRAGGAATRYACMLKIKEFTIHAPTVPKLSADETAQAIVEGALLAGYKFHEYKTKKEDLFEVGKVTIIGSRDAQKGVKTGTIYANAQNYARELDEKPANIATPAAIVKEARKLAKQFKLKATVYDRKTMEKMGMGGLVAVAKGSVQPPALVKVEYNKGKNYPLYCIVGKGITFDSGGLSLKPSKNMHEMKYDKTGAVNVLGVMRAVAELKLPVRLKGYLALTENVPSGSATKPGDIIKVYNGKTIEVLNTDAEGRLVLADALALAAEQKPKAIIDMATLTGAMSICLGRHAAGLFSNDDKLAAVVEEAGEDAHERVWRFPLWPEYGEMMKSDFADLKNISELPEAGSITAAAFLQEFVGETKWAHLDIASVDMSRGKHPYLDKGATGSGVRAVTRALAMLAKKK